MVQFEQLWSPSQFEWNTSKTPFADLKVIFGAWFVYFGTILTLKWYMSSREPFKLKYFTAVHNIILCLASLAMCVSTVIEVLRRANERGWDEVFCTTDATSLKGPLFYTLYMYYLSKYYELLDTIILVLKKKPLIFLHWYHHAVVILMVWTWLEYSIVFSTLGMFANTLVHVFMYYYYYAASLGKEIWFKRYLTSGQIFQFSMSFVLTVPYAYYHFKKGCTGGYAAAFSMGINGTFLILFIDFYLRTYKSNKNKKLVAKKSQ